MLKHVRINAGKSVYLGRETLMVRSSDQEFFSVPEPNEEKGRLGEEQEALLTAEEYDQWGEGTFKLLGDVDEEKLTARGPESIRKRMDRMVR